jgi:hypothetical protein
MAPEETRMICCPRRRMRRRSCASASSHARLSRPEAWSTSSAEPTLTTTRRASASRDTAGVLFFVLPCIRAHYISRPALPRIGGDLISLPTSRPKGAAVSRLRTRQGQWYENAEEEETFRCCPWTKMRRGGDRNLDGDIEEPHLTPGTR